MPGKKDEKVLHLAHITALIGPAGGSDPLGLSQPFDQQILATLAKDVRLTLGAGCQKDSKTANGSAEFSENLKTAVATDNYVFNTKLRLKLIELRESDITQLSSFERISHAAVISTARETDSQSAGKVLL